MILSSQLDLNLVEFFFYRLLFSSLHLIFKNDLQIFIN